MPAGAAEEEAGRPGRRQQQPGRPARAERWPWGFLREGRVMVSGVNSPRRFHAFKVENLSSGSLLSPQPAPVMPQRPWAASLSLTVALPQWCQWTQIHTHTHSSHTRDSCLPSGPQHWLTPREERQAAAHIINTGHCPWPISIAGGHWPGLAAADPSRQLRTEQQAAALQAHARIEPGAIHCRQLRRQQLDAKPGAEACRDAQLCWAAGGEGGGPCSGGLLPPQPKNPARHSSLATAAVQW
jgi:hypothetical protein